MYITRNRNKCDNISNYRYRMNYYIKLQKGSKMQRTEEHP